MHRSKRKKRIRWIQIKLLFCREKKKQIIYTYLYRCVNGYFELVEFSYWFFVVVVQTPVREEEKKTLFLFFLFALCCLVKCFRFWLTLFSVEMISLFQCNNKTCVRLVYFCNKQQKILYESMSREERHLFQSDIFHQGERNILSKLIGNRSIFPYWEWE